MGFLFLSELFLCSGSRQGRADLCSNQEGHGQDRRLFQITSLSAGAGGVQSRELSSPMNPSPLPCTLCHQYCCCYCLFSFVLADSSNLSQPVIFTFCASNSPPHPTQGKERRGFNGSTTPGKIIAKPQQAGIDQSLRTQLPTAALAATLQKYIIPCLY